MGFLETVLQPLNEQVSQAISYKGWTFSPQWLGVEVTAGQWALFCPHSRQQAPTLPEAPDPDWT